VFRHDRPLALLETCRQIYAETHTLPFELNAFSFDGVRTLKLLAKSAEMTARMRLVQTMNLQGGTPESGLYFGYHEPGFFALASQLVKPKVVEVTDSWEPWQSYNVTEHVREMREQLRSDVLEAMGAKVEVKFLPE
jgi:hypothetical protein